MSLESPLSVRSRNFCLFSVSEGGKGLCFCCVFRPVSEKEIPDLIAHGSITRAFTVIWCKSRKYFGLMPLAEAVIHSVEES